LSAAAIALRVGIGGLVAAWLARKVRRPSGALGRRVALAMNVTHSALTDWGLTHARVEPGFTILDVGCGGGRTIGKLAAMAPQGRVIGVDVASGSVDAANLTNARLVAEGRVAIHQAPVSTLPFPDGQFDLVTAVETQYYWPDLPADMREIRRVLKPGGTLVVIVESYRGSKRSWIEGPAMRFLLGATRLSREEQKDLFTQAGFADVTVDLHENRTWLCAVGRRPMDDATYSSRSATIGSTRVARRAGT
jgi:SAM-dependent methyltransferase